MRILKLKTNIYILPGNHVSICPEDLSLLRVYKESSHEDEDYLGQVKACTMNHEASVDIHRFVAYVNVSDKQEIHEDRVFTGKDGNGFIVSNYGMIKDEPIWYEDGSIKVETDGTNGTIIGQVVSSVFVPGYYHYVCEFKWTTNIPSNPMEYSYSGIAGIAFSGYSGITGSVGHIASHPIGKKVTQEKSKNILKVKKQVEEPELDRWDFMLGNKE